MAFASASSQLSLGCRLFLHSECSLQLSKFYFAEFSNQLKDESFKINPLTQSMSSHFRKGLCRQAAALPDVDDFYWEKAPTPILDLVDTPIHLKNLSPKELKQLADEIRSEITFLMSKSGPPFEASLAVVELTVAIHYVFNAPVDRILWDVGEQTYAHKILTGRRSLMHTLRQKNGISGFTSRQESEYDAFGAGHGCNSISAGLGMAVARDIIGKKDRVVTVISNWTTMAGQVYEAMSNAGYLDTNMVVILNDSRHSLHPKQEEGAKPTINALSSTFSKLQSSKSFRRFREAAKVVTKRIGKGMHEWAAKVDEFARGMLGPLGATLFEELGLYYIGPVDGQNIEDLICVLDEVASLDSTGPVLIHVITEAEHGPADITNGTLKSGLLASPESISCKLPGTYNDCLVEALIAEAEKDKEIVVVHAGMGMDPSLNLFQLRFPERFFDVGMAEQHAVTFAAGLSCGGLKPFCIIPSTFLQRAYDQIIEDVDLQNVPVRLAVSSAGLVGSDGPTKCGAFDITFMSCLPNMIVMAPADEDELIAMVAIAASTNDRPVCFRYPGGSVSGILGPLCSVTPIEVGKGEILVEGSNVALLGYGTMVQNCLKAQSLLAELNIPVTVANARFCKPLDIELVRKLCREHEFLITVEEGSIGGFGSHVAHFIALDGLLDGRTKWRPIVLPDSYIEHGTLTEQLDTAGLSGHHIAATALRLLGRNRDALMLLC
ncbi:hypothetical protein J5N97_030122 [Dioscorea zingiberensis]|uniref:1-deoxy-D-xylulose-5-phosphate synthase n=1 Tax=Dioscorea zingiberensis TaxID=325984 RepID=A0A9D5BX70_9LILI|nr:hypothetical protein J5N97_030122 [Dioscorea zingiberensis]